MADNGVSHADHRRLAALAQTLADRRSASASYVNVKVSAQGVLQPDVNVTPDTTEDDLDRMTQLAIRSVAAIMEASPPKPDKDASAEEAWKVARIQASRARKAKETAK